MQTSLHTTLSLHFRNTLYQMYETSGNSEEIECVVLDTHPVADVALWEYNDREKARGSIKTDNSVFGYEYGALKPRNATKG